LYQRENCITKEPKEKRKKEKQYPIPKIMEKEGLGLEITELRLGLPGGSAPILVDKNEKKRVFSDISGDHDNSSTDWKLTQTKNQTVGWPPVCSYRRKNNFQEKDRLETSKMYVKVSMDGAPFLRKVDLSMHKGYSDLAVALEKLFDCFGIGKCSHFLVLKFF